MSYALPVVAALALVVSSAALVQQSASQPVKSAPEYFVTSEGDRAHLWVREGANLRVIGHGTCSHCPFDDQHGHADGDGHDHGKQGVAK